MVHLNLKVKFFRKLQRQAEVIIYVKVKRNAEIWAENSETKKLAALVNIKE